MPPTTNVKRLAEGGYGEVGDEGYSKDEYDEESGEWVSSLEYKLRKQFRESGRVTGMPTWMMEGAASDRYKVAKYSKEADEKISQLPEWAQGEAKKRLVVSPGGYDMKQTQGGLKALLAGVLNTQIPTMGAASLGLGAPTSGAQGPTAGQVLDAPRAAGAAAYDVTGLPENSPLRYVFEYAPYALLPGGGLGGGLRSRLTTGAALETAAGAASEQVSGEGNPWWAPIAGGAAVFAGAGAAQMVKNYGPEALAAYSRAIVEHPGAMPIGQYTSGPNANVGRGLYGVEVNPAAAGSRGVADFGDDVRWMADEGISPRESWEYQSLVGDTAGLPLRPSEVTGIGGGASPEMGGTGVSRTGPLTAADLEAQQAAINIESNRVLEREAQYRVADEYAEKTDGGWPGSRTFDLSQPREFDPALARQSRERQAEWAALTNDPRELQIRMEEYQKSADHWADELDALKSGTRSWDEIRKGIPGIEGQIGPNVSVEEGKTWLQARVMEFERWAREGRTELAKRAGLPPPDAGGIAFRFPEGGPPPPPRRPGPNAADRSQWHDVWGWVGPDGTFQSSNGHNHNFGGVDIGEMMQQGYIRSNGTNVPGLKALNVSMIPNPENTEGLRRFIMTNVDLRDPEVRVLISNAVTREKWSGSAREWLLKNKPVPVAPGQMALEGMPQPVPFEMMAASPTAPTPLGAITMPGPNGLVQERMTAELAKRLNRRTGLVEIPTARELEQLYELGSGNKYNGQMVLTLDDLRYATEAGTANAAWYAEFGKLLDDTASGFGFEFPSLNAIFAVDSQQSSPLMDYIKSVHALAAINDLTQGGAKPLSFAALNRRIGEGSPTMKGYGQLGNVTEPQVKKIVRLWNEGRASTSGEALKTPTFGLNLAAALKGAYSPGVTVDTWEGALFGFGKARNAHWEAGARPSNPAQYLFAERIGQLIGAELGMSPSAAQASRWGIAQAAANMKPTSRLLDALGVEQWQRTQSYGDLFRDGNVTWRQIVDDVAPRMQGDITALTGDKRVQAALEELNASIGRHPTTAQAPAENPRLTWKSDAKTERAGDYGAEVTPGRQALLAADVAKRSPVLNVGTVASGANEGTLRLYREQQARILRALDYDEAAGVFNDLRELGIPHHIEPFGLGTWGGKVEPNYRVRLDGGNADTANWAAGHLGAKMEALGLPQDAVAVEIPGGPARFRGIEIAHPSGRDWSPEEFEALAKVATANGVGALQTKSGAVDVVQFVDYEGNPQAFNAAVRQTLTEAGLDATTAKPTGVHSYLVGREADPSMGITETYDGALTRLSSRFDANGRAVASRANAESQRARLNDPQAFGGPGDTSGRGYQAGLRADLGGNPPFEDFPDLPEVAGGAGNTKPPRRGSVPPDPDDYMAQLEQSVRLLELKKAAEANTTPANKRAAAALQKALDAEKAARPEPGGKKPYVERQPAPRTVSQQPVPTTVDEVRQQLRDIFSGKIKADDFSETADAMAEAQKRLRMDGGLYAGIPLQDIPDLGDIMKGLTKLSAMSKAMQAGADPLSYAGRQLGPTAFIDPATAFGGSRLGLQAYRTELGFKNAVDEIESLPNYLQWEPGEGTFRPREAVENFSRFHMTPNGDLVLVPSMQELLNIGPGLSRKVGGFQTPGMENADVSKLPVVGRVYGASERAQRVATVYAATRLYNGMVDNAIKRGITDPAYYKHYGDLAKAWVGFGDVPRMLKGLSNNFYSMQNTTARFQTFTKLLTSPGGVFSTNPIRDRAIFSASPKGQAFKMMSRFAVGEMANLAMWHAAGTASGLFEVGWNPLKPGFGKLNGTDSDGNDYSLDLLAGYGSMVKATAITGAAAQTQDIDKYDPRTAWLDFTRYKMGALPNAVLDFFVEESGLFSEEAKNRYSRNPANWLRSPEGATMMAEQLGGAFIPFFANDAWTAAAKGDIDSPLDLARFAGSAALNYAGLPLSVDSPSPGEQIKGVGGKTYLDENEVAQQVKSYWDLRAADPQAAEQWVKDHPEEYRAMVDNQREQSQRTREIRTEALDQQKWRDENLLAKQPEKWRLDSSFANRLTSERINEVWHGEPELGEPSTLLAKAQKSFAAAIAAAKHPQSGEVDWELVDREVAKMSENERKLLFESRLAGATPARQQYIRDLEKLVPYFETRETAWKELTKNDPQVSQFRSFDAYRQSLIDEFTGAGLGFSEAEAKADKVLTKLSDATSKEADIYLREHLDELLPLLNKYDYYVPVAYRKYVRKAS